MVRQFTKLLWGKGIAERHPIREKIDQSFKLLVVVMCKATTSIPCWNFIDEECWRGPAAFDDVKQNRKIT
jgi:hypothetical protein